MPDEPWLMRVEGALEAHFKQPTGPSRPGVDWTIGLKRGEQIQRVRVRSYFADDLTPEARGDNTYLGQTVMQYLNDLLESGWTPTEEREHVIIIGNPPPGTPLRSRRRWWQFWR